jgi:hypothetical protein
MPYIAYAVPREDHHLIVEDGLALMALGATREEAAEKVHALFDKGEAEMIEIAAKHGYTDEGDKLIFDDCYVLHTNEV